MLEGIHKIHLIGIGGSGMRAIANILIQKDMKYLVLMLKKLM